MRRSNPLKPALPRANPQRLAYAALKLLAIEEQNGRCLICEAGGRLTDLHHVFLKRSDLPGKLFQKHWHLINCIENVAVLHNSCHIEEGQTNTTEILIALFKLERYDLPAYFAKIRQLFPWWSTPAYEILP